MPGVPASDSPSRPAPGTRVEFTWRKWDGSPHWVHECVYLGSDRWGDWFGQQVGWRSARPGREVIAQAPNVTLVPASGEYAFTHNAPPARTSVYIDLAWDAGWSDAGAPVGIDMDLDVVQHAERGLYIDDRDEWDEHRVAFGYPADIVERLEARAVELERAVGAAEAPFDGPTADGWLRVLADLGEQANRADLGKDPGRVSGMFDQVAAGYDRTNTVLSMGNDKLWRAATTRAVAPRRGERILDLAAGTGASSVALAGSGATVIAADFSPGMIAEGRRRHRGIPNLTFVEADATDLPFDDAEFDAVTMSFGLRNVNDPATALRELLRVTRPGGRLVVCEFSHPPSKAFGGAYRFYNDRVLPVVAKAVSSNADAYDYLNESIRAWPDQRTLSAWIRDAGWTDVAYRNLTMGIVALHRAHRPE